MTAPAEDPRSGEGTGAILCGPPKGCTCPAVAWYCICDASTTPPAAGRGDTDSSGECQQSDWCGPGSHCLCRPAVDRAEPPEGLRERPRCACGGPCEHDGSLAREQLFHAAYDLIVDHPMWIDGEGRGLEYSPEREAHIGQFLEQLLALPELRRALGGPS